jgi:geranylgeranyl pyrophosphate synthase
VPPLFDLDAFLSGTRERVDAALRERLPRASKEDHLRLREAISYALLEGGKRLRPCLTVAACRAVGGTLEQALGPACAIEMIHAYSLVHDDLPAMDNDALRRGKPTCHRQFGETAAVLVGDALLTLAFETVAGEGLADRADGGAHLKMVHEIARAAGARGMVGGQAMDMALKRAEPSFEQIELCHSGKTAALFSASAAVGALAGGGDDTQVDLLRSYGFDFGLAFQHTDDLQDAEFVAHRERAVLRVLDLAQRTARVGERFGDAGAPLIALARFLEQRAKDARPDGTAAKS